MNFTRTYDVQLHGRDHKVTVIREDGETPTGTNYRVRIDDGPEHVVSAVRPVPDVLALLVDRVSWEAGLVMTDEGWDVEVVGVRHAVSVADPKRKALRIAGGGEASVIRTAMPGRVVRVLVEIGEAVSKGQPLVTVEAMKMENELKAPRDGRVKKIMVGPGSLVEAKSTLIELEGA